MDKKLIYSEFVIMILPLNNSELRQEAVEREIIPIKNTELMPYNIEYALAQLINKEIKTNEAIEIEKQNLLNRYDYILQSAFKVIDTEHSRYITFDNLKAFLKKMKVGAQTNDVIAFMRRVDQDLDCKVSYDEFAYALSSNHHDIRVIPSYITPNKSCHTGLMTKDVNVIRTTVAKSNRSNSVAHNPGKISNTKRSNRIPLDKVPGLIQSNHYRQTTAIANGRRSDHECNYEGKSIYEIIEEQLKFERLIEFTKQEISLRNDITLTQVYDIFDPERKGYITPIELLALLRGLKLNPDREAVYLLFERFDDDGDGKWNYKNIKELITPAEKDYNYIICQRKDVSYISKESIETIKKVIELYLQSEIKNKDLVKKRDIKKLFRDWDSDRKGFLTIEDVLVF